MLENHKHFFERLVFLPQDDQLDIELAHALCKHWFRAKFRKEWDDDGYEVRYFEHLRRVSLILIDELKLADIKMIITALCHDALEDTREDDLAALQLEKRFGRDVIKMVKLLSKVPAEGYIDRLINFADWRVLTIKTCDRLDNLRSLKYGSLKFQEKQLKEIKEKYYPLFDRMLDITPMDHVGRTKYLHDEIHKLVDNFVCAETPRKFCHKEYKTKEGIRKIIDHAEEYGNAMTVDENGKVRAHISIGNIAEMKKPLGDE